MLQHATFDVPRYGDGYCIDDNARALLLVTHLEEAGTEAPQRRPRARDALPRVREPRVRRRARALPQFPDVRADLARERRLRRQPRSRALGARSRRRSLGGSRTSQASRASLPRRASRDDRAHEPARVGLHAARHRRVPPRVRGRQQRRVGARGARAQAASSCFRDRTAMRGPGSRIGSRTATRASRRRCSSPARAMDDEEMAVAGVRSLEWLDRASTRRDGYFAPVGSNGFYVRGEARPSSISSPSRRARWSRRASTRIRVTGDRAGSTDARHAFQWFLGQNPQQLALYDPATGGCRDGIHVDRVNENQGAESTLSFCFHSPRCARDGPRTRRTRESRRYARPHQRDRFVTVDHRGYASSFAVIRAIQS